MRIALCDDEVSLAHYFSNMIQEEALKKGLDCQVRLFHSAKELLFETQGSYPFDLMLLDIEMPDMNGMELARRIRSQDSEVPIAFFTNFSDFVFDGYEVGAFRYLMKEQAEEKLPALLSEIAERQKKERDYLLLKAGGEDVKLLLSELLYLEADRHDTILHLAEGTQLLRLPFSRVLRQLPEYFAATHRSYVVNLSYVERLSRTECRLTGGESIPVSRSAYGALNEAFIAFYRKRQA